MSFNIRLLLLVGAFVFAGCVSKPVPFPLETTVFDGKTSVTSNREGALTVITGQASGSAANVMIPAGGILLSMGGGLVPELFFGDHDMRTTGLALRNELIRLGILKSLATVATDASSPKITLRFIKTHHNPRPQEYLIQVEMTISGGESVSRREYEFLSSEGDSLGDKWNTTPFQAKAKGARKLLAKLIPDIEAYVARMGP